MFKLMRLILTLLVCVTSINTLAAVTTEIYQPSHKPSQALIETLSPLYPSTKLSTDGKQIIMRGEEQETRQIQELLLQLDHPTRRFQVEISSQISQGNTKTYATKNANLEQQLFLLEEDNYLTISKAIETQQLSHAGPLWFQIETKPVQQEFIRMKLQAADDRVYLELELQLLKNGKFQAFSNTISGATNQWLPINGRSQNANQRQWSTTSNAIDELFIRVTTVD